MKRLLYILVMMPLLAFAQTIDQLPWQQGPTTGAIGSQATIAVPRGMGFLDRANSRRFMVLTENLAGEEEYVIGKMGGTGWWGSFEFDPTGYVEDQEKIDADELLKTLKEQNEEGNLERKKQGLEPLILEGWEVSPRYDSKTKRLEWCLRLKTSAGPILNYQVRILGREGVMQALLVTEPQNFANDLKDFRRTLEGFAFLPEKSYQAYQKGDKVAELGLAALIVGGAAAVAGKKFFGKILLGIGAAVVAAIGYFFKERKKS
jgi:uncharacterized membrane-anchored protein